MGRKATKGGKNKKRRPYLMPGEIWAVLIKHGPTAKTWRHEKKRQRSDQRIGRAGRNPRNERLVLFNSMSGESESSGKPFKKEEEISCEREREKRKGVRRLTKNVYIWGDNTVTPFIKSGKLGDILHMIERR